MNELPINQVVCGAFPVATHEWPDKKINLVMFSPPYWGLRNYGENANTVWGGDPSCEHKWVSEKFYRDSPTRNRSAECFSQEAPPKESRWHESRFCSKCGAWYGQLGLEPDYRMYIEHLVEVGREIKRILRKDGSWYLNLGDTYYTGKGTCYNPGGGENSLQNYRKNPIAEQPPCSPNRLPQEGVKAKCKLLMPYRVALALIDDGWVCRNDITWYKSNAMPSSVKDRLTCQTERVFHLTRSDAKSNWYIVGHQPDPRRKAGDTDEKAGARRRAYEIWCELRNWWRGGVKDKEEIPEKYLPYCMNLDYYYDLDAIREPHSVATIKRVTQPTIMKQRGGFKQDVLNPIGPDQSNFNRPGEIAKSLSKKFNLRVRDVKRGKFGTTAQEGKLRASEKEIESYEYPETNEGYVHPLGKNPGDVILTKHDKAVGRTKRSYTDSLHTKGYHPLGANPSDFWSITTQPSDDYWCPNCKDFVKQKEMKCVRCGAKVCAHFAVYPEALCERPIKSSCPLNGIVLDLMCGRGTTLVVAKKLGRRFIGIDINPDYCEMSRKWLTQVEWPLEVFA